jgi:hypothetical protein
VVWAVYDAHAPQAAFDRTLWPLLGATLIVLAGLALLMTLVVVRLVLAMHRGAVGQARPIALSAESDAS